MLNQPDGKVLHEIELNIKVEEELEKLEKNKNGELSEFEQKVMEAEIAGKMQAKVAEQELLDKENALKQMLNVFNAITSFAKEMISTTDLDKPYINLTYMSKEIGVDNVACFYFFDDRYQNEGMFYFPYLLVCDWESEESDVSIDMYELLKFNLKRAIKHSTGGMFGTKKILTSKIWEKDKKCAKVARRMIVKREAQMKAYRYEKYLALKKEFEAA